VTHVAAHLRYILVAACLAGSAPGLASVDPNLLAAKAAWEKGDRVRLAAVAPRLAGHPLEPYVAWWQLKLGADAGEYVAWRAFAERWKDTPLAERARIEELRSLGRRQDWVAFDAAYAGSNVEDVEVLCRAALSRRQREGDAALVTAKPLWFSGQATPDACDPVFASLIARGTLTVDDRWTRFRLAVEAGNVRLAQQIAGDLPAADRIDLREFRHVDAKPAAELAQGAFRWKQRDGRELALYALDRAARADPDAARAAWAKQRDRLGADERRWGNARLAYQAARQSKAWAHEAWREPVPDALPADVNAWRVRAHLRAQAWPEVLAAIDAMPAVQRDEITWRYWRARALGATGRTAESRALLEAIAGEHDYHGLLAAEELGLCLDPRSDAVVADAAWQASFAARPGVQRAIALAGIQLRSDSLREWAREIRDLDDDKLLQASMVAASHSMHDRAINTANLTRARHDYALRYPTPYRELFAAAAADQGVDESLLYGISRQESRFVPAIVSSAGAVGLMQLMPGTAQLVAKQTGRSDYTPARIGENAINTQFGAYYFRYWYDRLDGSAALAAAAYNAGPGRAQAWRPASVIDGAVWVETIPFNETRDYVKKVLQNSVWYARRDGDPAATLKGRLGVVGPRSVAAPATAAAKAAP